MVQLVLLYPEGQLEMIALNNFVGFSGLGSKLAPPVPTYHPPPSVASESAHEVPLDHWLLGGFVAPSVSSNSANPHPLNSVQHSQRHCRTVPSPPNYIAPRPQFCSFLHRPLVFVPAAVFEPHYVPPVSRSRPLAPTTTQTRTNTSKSSFAALHFIPPFSQFRNYWSALRPRQNTKTPPRRNYLIRKIEALISITTVVKTFSNLLNSYVLRIPLNPMNTANLPPGLTTRSQEPAAQPTTEAQRTRPLNSKGRKPQNP